MRHAMLILACMGLAATAHAGDFQLHVAGATADGHLPQRFAYDRDGCHGRNQRPDLSWSGAPHGTHGFAVSVFDPDAQPHGWWHWFVVDLPASVHSLAGDASLPASAKALRNDYGDIGWGGPCPPPGPAHHYRFTVYALDVAHLDLPPHAAPGQVRQLLAPHQLGSAQVTLKYGR